ncbi:hypothetical protein ACJZ2D_017069 [Fusarium nematophilum]
MALPAPGPASQWILILLAAAVIAARLYLRLKIQMRRLLRSDQLMCAAWVAAVATASFDVKFAQMGALDPQVKTTLEGYNGGPGDITLILKRLTETIWQLFWASSFPYFTTFYLCKAALLAVYLQIFPCFMRKRRIFLWCTITFVVVSYVITLLMVLCICLPVETNWSLDPEKKCPSSKLALVFEVAWILHFLGDLLVFALPWFIVPGLQLRKTIKLGVYCTFLLGIINISFCLVRLITIQTSQVDNALPLSLFELWSTLDCNIGLIIACLPSLRQYFQGKQGSDYPNRSTGYNKSPTSRAPKGVFEVVNDPYMARKYDGQRRPPRLSSSSNGFDRDHWDGGKKSTGSDIEEGLTYDDSLTDLEKRLFSFPTELEAFFRQMLESVLSFYHEKMAGALQVALYAQEPLDSMVYSFLDDEYEDEDY